MKKYLYDVTYCDTRNGDEKTMTVLVDGGDYYACILVMREVHEYGRFVRSKFIREVPEHEWKNYE